MSAPVAHPMPEPVSTGVVAVNGIEMYYAIYGSGSPLLLIHGGLGHGDLWAAQVVDLMADHLVIVADSRGHGRSSCNADPFGYDLMAADYLALLDFLRIDKVDLVGWSDGGIIGLAIAMSDPDRLDHLFAHAANITPDGVFSTPAQDVVFDDYAGTMAADYAAMSPTPDQFHAFVAQICQMWATQPNWTDDQVAAIRVRTAIVVGSKDELIRPEHSAHIADLIPTASLVILPGLGHSAMLQDPTAYNQAVRAFIDRSPPNVARRNRH